MSEIAKLFIYGRSHALRLPAKYRFDTTEVHIRQDPETGDIILSRKPETWDDFFAVLKGTKVTTDFLTKNDRKQDVQDRDPLQGWIE